MRTFDSKKPIKLQSSRAWRTYLGGKMISALHGEKGEDDHFPEEWLMSTVAARNAGREHITEGISFVEGTDMTLPELIHRDAEAFLGKAHTEKHGEAFGVLVKLLDAAERLTIQVHPTRECAERLFSSPFGKTECWHIIDERRIEGDAPCLYIGFKEGVTREKWKQCFDEQNIPQMLSYLHKIPVKKGDTFIIRGGVPHAIGAGCFLVEIQEPTDFTVRTERVTPSGLRVADEACHQGLGFDTMFDCFLYEGLSLEETLARYLVTPTEEKGDGYAVKHIIYPEVTPFFSLDLITVTGKAFFSGEDAFCGIYVLSGDGRLNGEPIKACDHYFIPAACQGYAVETDGEKPLTFIRFYGPK